MELERKTNAPSAQTLPVPLAAPLVVALVAALTSSLAVPAAGQSTDPPPELITDRPDQTESASVVPVGHVQLEVGAIYSRDEGDGFKVEVSELLSSLARIGVHDRVELRVGWAGFVDERIEGPGGGSFNAEGVGDLDVGAKFLLVPGADRRPQIALLVGSTLPTGDSEVTGDAYDPSFRFNFDYGLSDTLGVGVNLGAEWQSIDDDGRDEDAVSLVYTAVIGHSLSDTTGAFLEVFGSESIDGPDLPAEISLDGGFTWLLRPNLQLDLSMGVGLTSAADDYFVGTGVSYRWPR